MGDEKPNDIHKNASLLALGELSNQLGKRGFSLISSSPNSPSKLLNSRGIPAHQLGSVGDDAFWNRVAFLLEKLKTEDFGIPNCPNYPPEVELSPSKDGTILCHPANVGSLTENAQLGIDNSVSEVEELSGLAFDKADHPIERRFIPNVDEAGEVSIATSIPDLNVDVNSETCKRKCIEVVNDTQCEKTAILTDRLENDGMQCNLAAENVNDDNKAPSVDYLSSSRCELAVSSRFMETLNTKSFSLERCKAPKVDDSSSSAASQDLLNSCSCSFCTKAAYIWFDLHYQDLKGRISALMKSKKEASNLAQSFSNENAITNLELDLMSQWKSLFLHTESKFADESKQLQTNISALKDLRDGFKNRDGFGGD